MTKALFHPKTYPLKPPIPQIEAEIIRLLQAQDEGAIKLIFQHYRPALVGIIFKVLGDEELAEDVWQESLVKMWRFGPNFDPKKGRLFTWLLNICRNTALDKRRKKSFQVKKENIQTSLERVNIAEEEGEEMSSASLDTEKLVAQLEPKIRELIDLIYFEGYTQQEAADHLQIPLGTVKSRVRKGLQMMKKWVSS
ncbi:MAG: sigma-70 family RNA polymerase sigma factor [Bacteroidota bacterium]